VKTTPFTHLHAQAGARLIDFGGWNMPVQYSGVLEEHHTVRTAVGLFDVSHMGEVVVTGPQAVDYVQNLITNDINACAVNQAQYSAMCLPHGGIVDDLVIYRRGERDFLFCVNASNTDKDFAWMQQAAAGFDVSVENHSARYAQLALQGPKAEATLSALTRVALPEVTYYHFTTGEAAGAPMIIARTGYTGEDGFELFFDPSHAGSVWNAILEAGRPHGIRPIGLGARDTLRLEMKYALYGNDIDETTTPLEAGLGWVVKLNKDRFIGKQALLEQKEKGVSRRLIGFELTERNVPRHGYRAMDESGQPIGTVTSGAISPSLSKPIGMAYLPLDRTTPGSRFAVEIRQKPVPAVVVKTPFYKPPHRS
jgi:aminomethyltransferase